ncbi:hypothetical protein D479_19563 [Halobacillus sp. BAB-2008]|nr:hypothetical protein D479_19563 [Halobacillus sp. BAB-2008]
MSKVSGNVRNERENRWDDVDFYTEYGESIFIFLNNQLIIHQLKPKNKREEVQSFLHSRGVEKKA